MTTIYNEYSKYKCKVYKLPINLPISCPNRDGNLSFGGCTFCGESGTGYESLESSLSVKEQLIKNMEYIKSRYKAEKFIAYFQNYSNTYMKFERFCDYIKEAVIEDIVEISISTRPDCIKDEYLKFLDHVSKKNNINISIELGLQTVNHHTLNKINRGHTLAEFIDAVNMIKKYEFEICTHLIINLPWDNMEDIIEASKVISALRINQVKLHSLNIIRGTKMANQYINGEIKIIDKEEYIDRVIEFLEYLNPEIVIQRLIGRAPKEDTLFSNWSTSWWKIKDEIVNKMNKNNNYQGKKYNYLNGKVFK